jgi:MFS transporter, NNP family, nitrate/nitrite transporter
MFCRKKYSEYSVKVDPNQDDKSTEIRICNFKRPHMRYGPVGGL